MRPARFFHFNLYYLILLIPLGKLMDFFSLKHFDEWGVL